MSPGGASFTLPCRMVVRSVSRIVACAGLGSAVGCGVEPPTAFAQPVPTCGAPASDDATASNDAGAVVVNVGEQDAGTPSNGTFAFPSPDACAPRTACPTGIECGHSVDPCSGRVLACGSPCVHGDVCNPSIPDQSSQSCQPKDCAGKCDVIGVDSCGVPIVCPGCPEDMDCINRQCVEAGSASSEDHGACAALTCTPDPQTHLCGNVTDGCGQTMVCSCPVGTMCTGGVCSGPPPECAMVDGGSRCGTMQNACGSGSVLCGACSGGGQCVQGVCTGCAPPSCGNATCGEARNACGQSIPCGSCPQGTECVEGVCTGCPVPTCGDATCGHAENACGESIGCGTCASADACYKGQCCTPLTCANANNGGPETSCDPVQLGCGMTKTCAPCAPGEICSNHKCVACIPKTCADVASASCHQGDGCGNILNCCPPGTTCQSDGRCCASPEVGYNGNCCLPSCNPALPSGAQVSCGETIFCAPGQAGPPR
jgi:hypothetical protein